MNVVKKDPFGYANIPPRRLCAWNKHHSIGIVSPGYAIEKVSYGLSPKSFTYNRLTRVIPNRLIHWSTFLKNTPILLDYSVELVHTFNELPIGIRPYVVTFENELPRYLGTVKPWQLDIGFDLLANSRCRKILALSDIAASFLCDSLLSRGYKDTLSKVAVFRGAVLNNSSILKNYAHKDNCLKVLFVGRDAFGKGLLPMLDALEDCWSQGANIKATIISNFESRGLDKNKTLKLEKLSQRILDNQNILFIKYANNSEVHNLMRVNDVFLFPTLDESLGWVAVEAGMAGMPIISTDIFAIPELVLHGKTGWLIPMNKNSSSRWVGLWQSGEEYEREVSSTFMSIRSHLVKYLKFFLDNPEMVQIMGLASKAHMSSLYNPKMAESRLVEIYRDALNY